MINKSNSGSNIHSSNNTNNVNTKSVNDSIQEIKSLVELIKSDGFQKSSAKEVLSLKTSEEKIKKINEIIEELKKGGERLNQISEILEKLDTPINLDLSVLSTQILTRDDKINETIKYLENYKLGVESKFERRGKFKEFSDRVGEIEQEAIAEEEERKKLTSIIEGKENENSIIDLKIRELEEEIKRLKEEKAKNNILIEQTKKLLKGVGRAFKKITSFGNKKQEKVTEETSQTVNAEVKPEKTSRTGNAEVKPEKTSQTSNAEVKTEETSQVDDVDVKSEKTSQTSKVEVKPEKTSQTVNAEVKPEKTSQNSNAEVKPEETSQVDNTEVTSEKTSQTVNAEVKPEKTSQTGKVEVKPEETSQVDKVEVKPEKTSQTGNAEVKPEKTSQTVNAEVKPEKTSQTSNAELNQKEIQSYKEKLNELKSRLERLKGTDYNSFYDTIMEEISEMENVDSSNIEENKKELEDIFEILEDMENRLENKSTKSSDVVTENISHKTDNAEVLTENISHKAENSEVLNDGGLKPENFPPSIGMNNSGEITIGGITFVPGVRDGYGYELHGPYKIFGKFEKGKLEGLGVFYNENGKKVAQANYISGKFQKGSNKTFNEYGE